MTFIFVSYRYRDTLGAKIVRLFLGIVESSRNRYFSKFISFVNFQILAGLHTKLSTYKSYRLIKIRRWRVVPPFHKIYINYLITDFFKIRQFWLAEVQTLLYPAIITIEIEVIRTANASRCLSATLRRRRQVAGWVAAWQSDEPDSYPILSLHIWW